MIIAIADEVIWNWVIGTLAIGLPAIGAGIWRLWSQLIAFVKPMIETLYENFKGGLVEHRQLVTTMESNVPMVTKAIESISATQDKLAVTIEGQSKSLEQLDKRHQEHSIKLSDHSMKLDEILQTVKVPRNAG